MNDDEVAKRIATLIDEEQRLYQTQAMDDPEQARLKTIEGELDQCSDLPRQRRAKREFGQNRDEATVRGRQIVER